MTNLHEATDTDVIDRENALDDASDSQDGQPKRSLRGAINTHCRDCAYDPLDKGAGTWRAQVESCSVTSCSLYSVRPTTKIKAAARRRENKKQLPSTEE